jgi:tetratricopeptide (TPR) repeat protein/predicted Ser/Thr protein kinase
MSSIDPSEDDLDLYAEPTADEAAGLLADLIDAPEVEPPLRPGQAIGDHFTVVRELGAGAMGRVYLAFDNALDRAVAIKVHRDHVDGEAIARMRGEARAIARLKHPNVVGVYEVGEIQDRMFIVMEYIDGTRLDRWQRAKGRTWRDVLDAYRQAGEALVSAHRAGLVHRDFKPQNVMVEEDADVFRVRVLDFGLARAVESHEHGAAGSDLRDGLKTDGRVGTPAYVAPEQRRDGRVSEAADQYAFAVSLWEGLCGQRPPGGPLDGFRPPRWLLDIVRRGHAQQPDARWPSMREMLDALSFDPVVRRRRLATAVGAVSLVGLGGLGAHAMADGDPCSDAAEALGAAWDQTRREAVAAAFQRSEVPYASASLSEVEVGLDAYAEAWIEANDRVCTNPSAIPAGLEPRFALCLDRRRQALDALTAVLSDADVAAVERAPQAVSQLPAISTCFDLDRLAATIEGPESASQADAVESVRADIASAVALRTLGRLAEAVEAASTAAQAADATEYPPVVAEAKYALGRATADAGEATLAETTLREAYAIAVAQGHDQVALQAAQALVSVVGHDLARPPDGHEWAFHAEALHARPAAVGMETQTWRARGILYKDQGEYARAIELLSRTLETLEASENADPFQVAAAVNALASAHAEAGNHAEGKAGYERALAMFESLLPADHPRIASELANLSVAHDELGDPDTALELAQRALDIRKRVLSANHPSIADGEFSVGVVLLGMGRYDEALAALERSLDVMEEARGPHHPRVGNVWSTIGGVHASRRRFDVAIEAFERAVSILESADEDHPWLATALSGLGNVELESGDVRAAIPTLERALALQERLHGGASLDNAGVLMSLGIAKLTLGEPDEALAFYERVESLHEEAGEHPSWRLLLNAANAHNALDDTPKALAYTERAIEQLERERGPEHPQLIMLVFNLGLLLEWEERPEDARRAYERSLDIAEAALGKDAPETSLGLSGLASLDLDEKRYADAVSRLRRAVAVSEGVESAGRLAERRFMLARALWGDGQREEAVRMAQEARRVFAELDGREAQVQMVDKWLRGR